MSMKTILAGLRSKCARLYRRLVPSEKPAAAEAPPSSTSPYGHEPKTPMRVLGPDGLPFSMPLGAVGSDYAGGVAYVSRHGLLGSGVTCPVCGALAAQAGEWQKCHVTVRGEGINCTKCHHTLLASPDDDLDPVKPGESYDEGVYHKFARASNSTQRVRQRTVTDPPAQGDRILIEAVSTNPAENSLVGKYDNLEALIIGEDQTILGQGWRVSVRVGSQSLDAPADMGGIFTTVPKACCFLLVDATLRPKDRVRVLSQKGQSLYEGTFVGVVVTERNHSAVVQRDTGEQEDGIPIERIEKVVLNERPTIRVAPVLPPTTTPEPSPSSKE